MVDVSHRDILDKIDNVQERVVRVETRQQEHSKLAGEVREDVKEIKKTLTRMVGFSAGVAAAVSVIWIAILGAWNWIKYGGNT